MFFFVVPRVQGVVTHGSAVDKTTQSSWALALWRRLHRAAVTTPPRSAKYAVASYRIGLPAVLSVVRSRTT